VVHENYLQHINENASQSYSPDHRLFKFKAKLAVPFRSQLQFWLRTNDDTRQMVFSSRLSMRKAVEAAIVSVSLKTENSRKQPAYFLSILLMTLKCQSHQ
jgi:hypothetical protein